MRGARLIDSFTSDMAESTRSPRVSLLLTAIGNDHMSLYHILLSDDGCYDHRVIAGENLDNSREFAEHDMMDFKSKSAYPLEKRDLR